MTCSNAIRTGLDRVGWLDLLVICIDLDHTHPAGGVVTSHFIDASMPGQCVWAVIGREHHDRGGARARVDAEQATLNARQDEWGNGVADCVGHVDSFVLAG